MDGADEYCRRELKKGHPDEGMAVEEEELEGAEGTAVRAAALPCPSSEKRKIQFSFDTTGTRFARDLCRSYSKVKFEGPK